MSNLIALGALVVSGIAAVLVWIQNGRQHDLALRLAAIEEDRRRDETAPRFKVSWDRRRGRPALHLTNTGPVDCTAVAVEIVPHGGAPTVVLGFGTPAEHHSTADLGPMQLGQSVDIDLAEDTKGRGGVLRLRLRPTTAGGVCEAQLQEVRVNGFPRVHSLSRINYPHPEGL